MTNKNTTIITTIKTKAYIPSATEYDKYFSRFRAFMGARLSQKAKEKGAWKSYDYDKGYFFMRSALSGSSIRVWYGYDYGTRGWSFTCMTDAGLRVAFQTIYDPKSSLVKGSRKVTQKSLVYDENGKSEYTENGEIKKVTSTADIVKIGGIDCIWINKEECENGTAKTMEFWTLDLIDKAEPFAEKGNHKDYAKATKLQEQCWTALTKNFTEEEKAMLVEVEMSSEDGYEKATPILEMENKIEDEQMS